MSLTSDGDSFKRARDHVDSAVSDLSEYSSSTSSLTRGLRRTKKFDDISKADQSFLDPGSSATSTLPRESRFQEGSLSDRPIAAPPSNFLNDKQTEHLKQQEKHRSDYHLENDNHSLHSDLSEQDIPTRPPQRASVISTVSTRREKGPGLFRLSRDFAASLHPVALWNKLWSESRDELAREDMQEASRRARIKAEAEEKYAQLKRDGLFGSTPSKGQDEIRGQADHSQGAADGDTTMQDQSFVAPADETDFGTIKPIRGLRARLSFKRPSLINLKENVMKRVRSDYDIAAAFNQDSSTSASPVKTDVETSVLRRTTSKYDLRRQHKLSKRVSDLEQKLQQARKELDEALIEASPMPKFSSRHDHFVPTSIAQRPRFVPGALPTLPSESLLKDDAQMQRLLNGRYTDDSDEEMDGEDTVRPLRNRQYPARASSLFASTTSAVAPTTPQGVSGDTSSHLIADAQSLPTDIQTSVPFQDISGSLAPSSPLLDDQPGQTATSSELTNVKPAKSRKRKSSDKNADKTFRPDTVTADSDHEEPADHVKKKRKRKSLGAVNDSSPNTKRPKSRQQNAAASTLANIEQEPTSPQSSYSIDQDDSLYPPQSQFIPPQFGLHASARNSMESQAHSLEPLYEEDEENHMFAESNNSNANATPRQASDLNANESRHDKTSDQVFASGGSGSGASERRVNGHLMMRAGEAARRHRAKGGPRNASNRSREFEWPDDVF